MDTNEKISTLEEREAAIISDFEAYGDWMERYQYLVDLGSELPPLEESEKNERTLIKGCQSQVWLTCDVKDDRVYFRGESDAVIVRGVVALLISVLSGATVDEVAKTDFAFIDKIGLREHLSPNRSNGLMAMMHQMKVYALAVKAKDMLL